MKRASITMILLAICGISLSAIAGLPEPSALFYGSVLRHGVALHAADNVVIRARVNRVPQNVFPGPEDWIVGQQRLGEGPGASNQDCTGGDCYVLSVRLESVPAGLERTPGTAAIGDEVLLCVQRGEENEVCGQRDRVRMTERGLAARRNLGLDLADFDWNDDGRVDRIDHDALADCLGGPAAEAAPRCQEAFDAANFGSVDLASFARLQVLFSARR